MDQPDLIAADGDGLGLPSLLPSADAVAVDGQRGHHTHTHTNVRKKFHWFFFNRVFFGLLRITQALSNLVYGRSIKKESESLYFSSNVSLVLSRLQLAPHHSTVSESGRWTSSSLFPSPSSCVCECASLSPRGCEADTRSSGSSLTCLAASLGLGSDSVVVAVVGSSLLHTLVVGAAVGCRHTRLTLVALRAHSLLS